jgi:hypothetical protein
MEEDVRKNFLVYRIKHSEGSYYKDLLPDTGWSLKLGFEEVVDTFALNNRNWIYYKVTNDDFTYKENSGRLVTQRTHPDGGIPEYSRLSRTSLIAVDESSNVIFIGGNFFRTSISDNFNISEKNPKSFFPFLRLKYFNYGLENIKFIKKRNHHLNFEAFSGVLQKHVKISVNCQNRDDVYINQASE